MLIYGYLQILHNLGVLWPSKVILGQRKLPCIAKRLRHTYIEVMAQQKVSVAPEGRIEKRIQLIVDGCFENMMIKHIIQKLIAWSLQNLDQVWKYISLKWKINAKEKQRRNVANKMSLGVKSTSSNSWDGT